MQDLSAFLFGLLVGSFMNVLIWRLPREESIVWPGSSCPKCKAPIKPYDNIPILSYLILRAKCRKCSVHIPIRYPIIEFFGGLAVWFGIHTWGFTPYGIAAAAIFCAFIVITVIDWEHQIIPDEITYTGIIAGPIFSTFFPMWHYATVPWEGLLWSAVGCLVGGGVLYGMGMLGEFLFKKEAMGGGDVKLMAAVGAFLGWKAVLLSLFLGSLVGAFAGLGIKWATKRDYIAFGPFLVAGTFIYMLWGERILTWYFKTVLQY